MVSLSQAGNTNKKAALFRRNNCAVKRAALFISAASLNWDSIIGLKYKSTKISPIYAPVE
jgi:hypothetical protein